MRFDIKLYHLVGYLVVRLKEVSWMDKGGDKSLQILKSGLSEMFNSNYPISKISVVRQKWLPGWEKRDDKKIFFMK